MNIEADDEVPPQENVICMYSVNARNLEPGPAGDGPGWNLETSNHFL